MKNTVLALIEMDPRHRIVSKLPLEQIWSGSRLISTIKIRDVGSEEIAQLLRSGVVRFIVADVGRPLEWIPNNERYDFWRDEVRPHLADPEERRSIDSFPDNYCYFASEWTSYDDEVIVVLSKSH